MSKILVLCGPPASGKSTYAREFIKGKTDWVIVNRDSIREGRGDYWVPSQEDYISDLEEFSVRAAIKRNYNVIIDATNLNPKTQEKWRKIATETKSSIEFKEFYIPFKEALERDKNRERSVGEKVLKNFYLKYYPDRHAEEISDKRYILEQNKSLPKCIVVDIDGTVAINQGRSPYDLTKVSEDKSNDPLVDLLRVLSGSIDIIFFSGREGTKQCREDTAKWINDNINIPYQLYMRKEKDYRPDEVIKEELYNEIVKDNYYCIAIFDDRDRVIKKWREMGLLACQVYYGDF